MVISNNSSQQKKNPIPALNSPLTVAQAVPQNQGKAETTQETSPLPTTQAITPKALAPALPPLIPKFTPVNVDKNPNQPFSSLAVQLHLSSSRALTVRVLDGQGNELVLLFNGTLPVGTWAFEWNGLLTDGRLAPPGMYKIEVRAGSWVQTKDVLIQK
jgi:hypothetical protein